MARHISPPLAELERLRTKLTEGEMRVFRFFDDNLGEDWEIYLQPHMNGLEPDFVLLNPNVGIAVFEVKDWALNDRRFPYRMVTGSDGKPKLVAGTGSGANREGDNPLNKAKLYRNEIFDLYCPRLAERFGNSGFAAVSAGVIFPNCTGAEARQLFGPSLDQYGSERNYFRVSGRDDLESEKLAQVFPEGIRARSQLMDEDMAQDLRGWLEEPEYHREQRRPLILNGRQKELVTSRTASGYRRVKGPAGSGKSIVIAARAATLALEGKRVLVVCFNVTLINYLRDLCARWTSDLKRSEAVNEVTWINFHQWCKRICLEAGAQKAYSDFWRARIQSQKQLCSEDEGDDSDQLDESVFYNELSDMISEVLDRPGSSVKYYDAILVDEGQDFVPGWWNALRKVSKPGGELLLAADSSQDIYEKARSWTDEAMKGAGFAGDWFQLQGSYRLPTLLLPLIQKFARDFLPEDLVDAPAESQADFFSEIEGACHLRWVQVDSSNRIAICLEETLRLAASDKEEVLPIPDITVLVSKKKDGAWLAEKLKEKNIRTIHTFAGDRKGEGIKKRTFYKGAARVKITTVHSFKGIESRAMVICLSEGGHADMALAYTAMTRLKRVEETERGSYLTVVCDHPSLYAFGKTWPDHVRASVSLPSGQQSK